MPAQTQTRKILIKVDTADSKGIREIADKMGLLNKNTKSLASSMNTLTASFSSLIGFLGVREIARMSDEMQNLSNRLKITALAGEDTNATFLKIADLANTTKQSIGAVGEVYNRMAIALGKVNPKSDELISLTETIINTFKVSGATAQEAANATIQLSQAFSLGALRGQDLRSVMSQNSVLAQLLTKRFGSDLFKQAEKGAIKVSTVMDILAQSQKEVAAQAEKLAPTFEQTLTVAANKLSVAIKNLNDNFHLSAGFAKVMGVAMDNLGSILSVLGGVVILVAATYVPKLIAGIEALTLASIKFARANLIVGILTAIVVVGGIAYDNIDKLSLIFKKLELTINDLTIAFEEKLLPLFGAVSKVLTGNATAGVDEGLKRIEKMKKLSADLRAEIAAGEKKAAGKRDPKKDILDLEGRQKGSEKGADKLQKIKEILGEVNKEFLNGKVSVEEYNRKLVNFELYKLNREFKEGKFDIFAYNQKLKELNLQQLNRELKNGLITFSQFQDSVRQNNIDELNAKFQAGKITLTEYNTELIKISDKFLPGSALQSGTAAYLESIGTLSENIAKAITSTFTHLEDTFVDFIKTGTFDFAKFTQSILDDLTRIIIRASIIRPLAGAILNGFGGSGAGTQLPASNNDFSNVAAKGMAFDSGVRKFASGGIVDSPTAFRFGGGKRGLMGEAGTEAILPLQRSRSGDLGVSASVTPVTINIINQSDSNIEQKESTGANGEKTIDILVSSRVREGILTGKFDSAFKSSYGLTRKGS